MPAVKKAPWTEVRTTLLQDGGAPTFVRAVDQLLASAAPDQPLSVYVAKYPYSELIVDKGEFRPPCARTHSQGQTSCSTCRELLKDVQYSAIPLAVSLNRPVEVFLDLKWDPREPRMAPLRLIRPAEPFGVFEVLDTLLGTPYPKPPWSVSAGARSVWILAPMGSDELPRALNNLVGTKIRSVQERPPHEIIAAAAGQGWRADIVIFPDAVISKLTHSDKLFQELLRTGWTQSSAVRHALFRTNEYLPAVSNGSPLSDLYLGATVRHLTDAAKGAVPIFEPTGKANLCAGPFQVFENALVQALRRVGLQYNPAVLQPVHLSDTNKVGYYSFRCPTLVGINRPAARVHGRVPLYVKECLESVRGREDHMIDFTNTMYFALKGTEEIVPSSRLPLTDFYSPEEQAKLFLRTPFLVSGVRLARV